MKIAVMITRNLLGLIYLVFGLNFFFHFMKSGPMTGPGGAFSMALFEAGYLFPFMKIIEVSTAVFLLLNRFTAFFLVLIFPVTVNIFLFHTFLQPSGLPIAIPMLLINLFLAFAYRKYYGSIFTVSPHVA